jgi:hypothetical protein
MKKFYKDRSFTVYVTADNLMEESKAHCRKYGYSLSKLGQIAIAEKLERERNNNGTASGASSVGSQGKRQDLGVSSNSDVVNNTENNAVLPTKQEETLIDAV